VKKRIFHSLALGYPSIYGCNAICLQDENGLQGVHVSSGNDFTKPDMQNAACLPPIIRVAARKAKC